MARPTRGQARKKGMCVSVTDQTRLELGFISEHYSESISALISDWATKEAKAICERTGAEFPLVEKLNDEDASGV